MSFIAFTVPGTPIPKLRARHRHVKTKAGREFTTSYTPDKTVKFERRVRDCALFVMSSKEMFTGPLALRVIFRMPVPPSWSAKKKAAAIAGSVHHVSRPDFGNLLKSVEDAMNGVVYKDDSAIVSVSGHKCYDDFPGVEITVANYER